MTTFDPKAVTFHQFAQAMRKVGYATTDPQALLAAYFTVQQMLNGKTDRGPVPSIVLDGPPGTGKSYMAECVAWMFQAIGFDAAYIEYNCHPDSSYEDFVKDINIEAPVVAQSGFADRKPKKEDLYIPGPLLQAMLESQKRKVVLLIDELDKARPAVDALLLTALNSGRLTVQGLGDNGELKVIDCNRQNLIVVIAKNDERDLHPALLRRGRVIYIDYPSPEVEMRILKEQAGIGDEAARSIVTQANKLRRRESNIGKPPSLPELVRLARDFALIADQILAKGVDAEGAYTCTVPKNDLNDAFVSGMLAKQEDQPLGRKLLKDKSFGTAFLSAILRGKGSPNRKIRYLAPSALLGRTADIAPAQKPDGTPPAN